MNRRYKMTKLRTSAPVLLGILAALSLAACVNSTGNSQPTKNHSNSITPVNLPNDALFLGQNPVYADIAYAAMNTSIFPEIHELEALRHKSKGHKRLRLPRISPIAALTSPGEVVARLLFEQVVFDNGRYRAGLAAIEAEEAKVQAEYQIAANDAVSEAIVAYLQADGYDARAALAERSSRLYQRFSKQANERLQGGVGSAPDVALFDLKAAEMKAAALDYNQVARQARQKFELLTGQSFPDVSPPVMQIPFVDISSTPIYIASLAQSDMLLADADRAKAESLPSVVLSAIVEKDGSVGGEVGLDNWDLLAGSAANDAARSRHQQSLAQAAETLQDVKLRVQELRSKESGSLQSAHNAHRLARMAKSDIGTFEQKLMAGQSQIAEAVSVISSAHRAEMNYISAQESLLTAQLEMARISGLLIPQSRGAP